MIFVKAVHILNQPGNRSGNEDAVYPSQKQETTGNLFMVCDGVGGAAKGEIASQLACTVFSENISGVQADEIDAAFLQETAEITAGKFGEYLRLHPGSKGMATTLTLALVKKNSVLLAWCGDSRVYHIRDGKILFRTKDHSLVQQLVDMGELTEEEAARNPDRNKILRAVSEKMRPQDLETKEQSDLQSGDYFLLCSDGLLEQISETVIAELFTLQNSGMDFSNAVNALCEGRTSDNYSMVLAQLGNDPANKGSQERKKYKKLFFVLISLLAAGILTAGYIYFRKYF